MDTYSQLFDVCVIISGVYMLYCGVTGKGSIYNNEVVKKGMEEKYRKLIRWFCLCGSIFAFATGLLDYFKIEPIASIMFAIFTLMIIGLVIMISRFTERKDVKRLK